MSTDEPTPVQAPAAAEVPAAESTGSSGPATAEPSVSPAAADAGTEPRRGKRLIISGVVLMALGVLTAIIATIGLLSAGSGLIDAFRADPISVPGEATLQLEPATYSVLQLSDGTSYRLALDDIQVTGPSGSVTVRDPNVSESLGRGDKVYESVAQFRVSTAGSYTVALTSQGPSEVIISQSIGGTLARSAVWFGLFGLAAVLGLVGLGLLIFGIVRRSMKTSPPTPTLVAAGVPTVPGVPAVQTAPVVLPPAAPVTAAAPAPAPVPVAAPIVLPPAGWYPDPEVAGRQRYWDGTAWTEHRA